MGGEQVQQGELLVGQGDAHAATADAALEHVDLQVGDLQVFFFTAWPAPGQGAQARHQFGEGKRLDQVIVGAQLQALDAVGNIVPGGQEQHRRVGFLAQATQHFPAVHLRHHHVQHDHVERGFQGLVQTVHAIAGKAHGVTQFLQAVKQVVARLGLVFDYEDIHGIRPGDVQFLRGASVARSIVIGAADALYLIVQHVFAALAVEVVEARRDNAALAVGIGARQYFGHVHVHEEAGGVMDHRGGGGGIGKGRAGGEEGSKAEDKQFHGGISL
eukprot:gene19196-biopygen10481